MILQPLEDRRRIASCVRSRRDAVAARVTAEFLQGHPGWLESHGERGRSASERDALHHLDFLAAAVESGSEGAFADYARWTAGVLRARGLAVELLSEALERIAAALAEDLPAGDAAPVAAILHAALVQCGNEPPSPASEAPLAGMALGRSLFVRALLDGNRRAAEGIALETLHQGVTPLDLYVDFLQEAMYQIGHLWEANQASVAQEHMATAIVQYIVARLYAIVPPPTRQRGGALVAVVAGEMHELGAHILADALEADGWDVRFLGANVPSSAILGAVSEHRPQVVGISAALLTRLGEVASLVGALRRKFSPPPRILLGGAAIRLAPELARELGVETVRDARATVELLRRPRPAEAARTAG